MSITDTTRRQSYAEIKHTIGPRQLMVLESLEYSTQGLTVSELSDLLRLPVHSISGRLTELSDLGAIRSTGVRFNTETDRNQTVWVSMRTEEDGQGVLF